MGGRVKEIMIFQEIFKFELGYQLKRISTWIYTLILGILTFLWVMGYADLARELNLQINSLLIISGMAAFPGMFALIVICGIGGDAAMRDISLRMDQILYATSVNKSTLLGARFLALFFMVLILMIFTWLFSIGILFFMEGYNTSLFGSFLPQFYFVSILLFSLPNCFIGSALVYSTMLLTRSTMASYIAALIIFLCSIISMDLLIGPSENYELGKLMDPSGAAILKEIRLNEMDFNIVGPGSEISVLENRLFWLCISFIILVFAFRKFQFTHHFNKQPEFKFGENFSSFLFHLKLPDLSLSLPWNTIVTLRVKQVCVLATRSFRELMWSPGGLVLATIILIQFFLLPDRHLETYGAENPPSTQELLFLIDHPIFHFIIAVIIILFSGHLVWRERDANMNEVFDTLPIHNYIIFLGKFIGLLSIIFLMHTMMVVTAIAVQVEQGYYDFDVTLYLQSLLGFGLMDYILFSGIAISAQIIINHKYASHSILIFFYFYTIFPETFGIHNNLLIFGSPDRDYWVINDLNFLLEWVILKAYWVGWVIVLSLISIRIMARGKVLPREHLIKERGSIIGSPIVRGIMIFTVLMALVWTFMEPN